MNPKHSKYYLCLSICLYLSLGIFVQPAVSRYLENQPKNLYGKLLFCLIWGIRNGIPYCGYMLSIGTRETWMLLTKDILGFSQDLYLVERRIPGPLRLACPYIIPDCQCESYVNPARKYYSQVTSITFRSIDNLILLSNHTENWW